MGSAIAVALAGRGVASIRVTDVRNEAGTKLVERLAGAFPGVAFRAGPGEPSTHDLAVNATPLGSREGDALPFDVDGLTPATWVGDVVLGPGQTPMLARSRTPRLQRAAGNRDVVRTDPALPEVLRLRRTDGGRTASRGPSLAKHSGELFRRGRRHEAHHVFADVGEGASTGGLTALKHRQAVGVGSGCNCGPREEARGYHVFERHAFLRAADDDKFPVGGSVELDSLEDGAEASDRAQQMVADLAENLFGVAFPVAPAVVASEPKAEQCRAAVARRSG